MFPNFDESLREAFRRETELFVESVFREDRSVLDLLSADEASRKAQSEAIIAEIAKFSGSDNLVMVTHLENIRELTGISPREGEAVIVQPDGERLRVLGRIVFN